MAFKISSLKTDTKRETEGVWHDWYAGARLKVARARNPRFVAKIRKLSRNLRGIGRRGLRDDAAMEQLEDITRKAYAETILLDWSGLAGDDGKEIPYSKETAYDWLTKYSDMYLDVQEMAEDAESYREDQIEESEKNSPSVSSGS